MENLEKSSSKKSTIKIPVEIIEPNISPEEFNVTAETYRFLNDLFEVHGYEKYSDVTEGYKELEDRPLIVRREDPRKVMSLFTDGKYEIGFEDKRYSNCVEWKPETDGAKGIMNAYLEGMTNLNNVVTVVGLDNEEEFDVVRLEDAQADFYGLNRDKVRSIKGEVTEDDVAFISLRIPGHLLTEEDLTEEEIDQVGEYLEERKLGNSANPVMIHRTYIKNRSVN